jgi:TolB-like protein/tetratricopeptide (TPR) repeat protein
MPEPSFLQRLKERKLVQWALAYLAGAFVAFQAVEVMAEPWGISPALQRVIHVLLLFGLLVTLVLAWYHGEKGQQRATGTELLLLTGVLLLAAIALPCVAHRGGPEGPLEGLIRIPEASAAPVPRSNEPMVRQGASLAVLPFANFSPDPDDAYLADGIHEDVLNHLAGIAGLTLISRQSVLRYRDTDLTIPEISEQLRVGAILEGSLRRQGNRIRVVAQLIDSRTDAHLWSRTLDRELDDVFRVQSEIARAVAAALKATLTPGEEKGIDAEPTGSVNAYDFYIRGRETLRGNTPEDNDEAIRLFRRALELDSAYAGPWAGIADAYAMGRLRFGLGYEWTDSAVAAAQKAIELDPELADGHKALGMAYSTKGWYRLAIAANLRAIEISPSHGAAVNNLAVGYSTLNVFDETLRWMRRSFQVRPNGRYARSSTAIAYTDLGERELAERWLDDALALDPNDPAALRAQAELFVRWGELNRATATLDSLLAKEPTNAFGRVEAALVHLYARDYARTLERVNEAFEIAPEGLLLYYKWAGTLAGFAHLQEGRQEEADSLFHQTLAINQRDLDSGVDVPRAPWENASIFAAMGQTDQALAWAEAAYEMGQRRYWDAEMDPMFDSIRDHPRFKTLLERMRSDVEEMRQRMEREEKARGLR